MKVYSNYRFSITNSEETYNEPTIKNILINNEILIMYLVGIPTISILALSMFYCIPIWFIYQGIKVEFIRNLIELTYMVIFTIVPVVTIYYGVIFGVERIKIYKRKGLNILSFILPLVVITSIGVLLKSIVLTAIILIIISYIYTYFIARRHAIICD